MHWSPPRRRLHTAVLWWGTPNCYHMMVDFTHIKVCHDASIGVRTRQVSLGGGGLKSLARIFFFYCLHENQVGLPEYYLIPPPPPKMVIWKNSGGGGGGLQRPPSPMARTPMHARMYSMTCHIQVRKSDQENKLVIRRLKNDMSVTVNKMNGELSTTSMINENRAPIVFPISKSCDFLIPCLILPNFHWFIQWY